MPRDGTLREGEVLFQASPSIPLDDRIARITIAENLLREHGWVRDWRHGPKMCAGLALLKAYGHHKPDVFRLAKLPTTEPILDAIQEVTGRRFPAIEAFNDWRQTVNDRLPDTTVETVYKVFDVARANIASGRYGFIARVPSKTLSWWETLAATYLPPRISSRLLLLRA